VDTIASRLSIWRVLKRCRCYWLDLGNGATTGQVVLGEMEGHFKKNMRGEYEERANRLPHVFDLFPHLRRQKDKANEPSCSLIEALEKQDLFINSTLANAAGQILWQLLRHGRISNHGAFINLDTGRTVPMAVPPREPPPKERTLMHILLRQ
jgi:PRTRC genetic system ThiF family protein